MKGRVLGEVDKALHNLRTLLGGSSTEKHASLCQRQPRPEDGMNKLRVRNVARVLQKLNHLEF